MHDKSMKVSVSILIISDSRTETTDETGAYVKKKLTESGHTVNDYKIVPDEPGRIAGAVKSSKSDVVITSGGTGVSNRDVTIETLKPLFEKELTGFSSLFTQLSYEQVKSSAILSRATAGIIQGKIVFCLPGNPNAVKLALERIIIPELGHIVKHAKK